MSQLEAGKRLPNQELGLAIERAHLYTARLKYPQVHDFLVVRELLASPSIQKSDHDLFKIGVNKNTFDLAVRSVFGSGDKNDEEAVPFSPRMRDSYEAALTVAAEEDRLAEPADLLGTILEDPSIAMKMIISQIAEENALRNGAPFRAESRAEVWATLLRGANGGSPDGKHGSKRFYSLAPKKVTYLD